MKVSELTEELKTINPNYEIYYKGEEIRQFDVWHCDGQVVMSDSDPDALVGKSWFGPQVKNDSK